MPKLRKTRRFKGGIPNFGEIKDGFKKRFFKQNLNIKPEYVPKYVIKNGFVKARPELLSNVPELSKPELAELLSNVPELDYSDEAEKLENEVADKIVGNRLDKIKNEFTKVLPGNEEKFQEYVNHEWDNCNSNEIVKGWLANSRKKFDKADFIKKIQADKSYDTTNFTDEDYDRLFSRCSSANKEEFSDKLRQTEEGKFILNPRTGGKRNKTKKNKRKSKTYKKGRK